MVDREKKYRCRQEQQQELSDSGVVSPHIPIEREEIAIECDVDRFPKIDVVAIFIDDDEVAFAWSKL